MNVPSILTKFFYIFIAFILLNSFSKNKNATLEKTKIFTKNIVGKLNSTTANKENSLGVAGKYIQKNQESSCDLEIDLYWQGSELLYKIKTNSREFSDSAKIEETEDKSGYYLTLHNYHWAEYEGPLNENMEPENPDLATPTDVPALISNEQITIQNTGNSMNYYVIFDECDLKYIQLTKQ